MKNRFVIEAEPHSPRGAENQLQHEARILKLVVSAQPIEETLEALIRTVEAQSSQIACSILLFGPDRRRLRFGVAPSLPSEFRRMFQQHVSGERADSGRLAAFQRDQVCVADIATDPLWEGHRELALQHGLHTCWSKPILGAERRVLGTFAIFYRGTRAPRLSDLWFVEIAAHGVAIALQCHETGQGLRRWQDHVVAQQNRLQSLEGEVNALLAQLGRPDRYALSFPA